MIKLLRKGASYNFLLLTVIFIVFTALSVIFNIPIQRQFSGFIFLTFVPGFLILAILKLDKLGMVEKIVLSLGLSVSFVMLFGLLVNYLALAVGYTKPLSIIPLLVSFGIATIVLAAFVYLRNKDTTLSFPHFGLTIREKLLLIIPSLLPLLSIIGMRLMNTTNNNFLLMLLLLLIPAYVIFIAVYQSEVSERLYPAFVYLIGISILLLMSLRGNHILGSDIHDSYYIFQTTLDKLHWSIETPGLVESLLSISLLPAIYEKFMNINPEYLFKVLYSLIFSICPLIVFVIAKKYVGSFYAFVASFLFMAQVIFLWTPGVAQTNLAILFFALALMVHFHDGISEFARRLFFLVFAVSSVVSHYSTSFIFLFILLLTWIGTQILLWVHSRWKMWMASRGVTTKDNLSESLPGNNPSDRRNPDSNSVTSNTSPATLNTSISITVILLFFVVIFFWHAQITRSAFDTAVGLLSRTFASLAQSFLVETKGASVAGAFGQIPLVTIPQQIRFIFYWLTVLFVSFGGLIIAARYKSAVAYPGSENTKVNSLESKFELEYFVLSAVCGIILTVAVILPYVSSFYSMERIYFQVLVVLSPFFSVCGVLIARWLRISAYLILLLVLIPFFMSVTGTTYQLFHIPASLLLNSSGAEYEYSYIRDEESYAAKWLGKHTDGGLIYTDAGQGPRILQSQGGIQRLTVRGDFIKGYQQGENIVGYIYLFYPQVVKGEAVLSEYVSDDIVPLPDLLASRDKVYTAGPTDIYYSR